MLDFSVTFIITIVNMVVLFFILRTILFKRVTKFMDERTKRIQDSIDRSEKDKSQAKALLAQYETQLKTAEAEAEAIINSARESAQVEAEKIIAEGRLSAEIALESTRKQLELEQKAAIAAFRKEAATLVVEASGRLLSREIKTEDNLKYADMLLKEAALNTKAEED